MQRPLTIRRSFSPLLAPLAIASTFAACAPWDLDDDVDYEPPLGGSVVVQASPPPAISGGTLAVSRDKTVAVAADPDRDRVWVVDLEARKLRAEIVLQAGDEPGRVAEDADGRFHVALRRGGAVVIIDAARGALGERREVCPAPRGIAYDASINAIHVACLGGELVTLPASGGQATRRLRLERDLRDVVVDGDRLHVSLFRSAELLTLDTQGNLLGRKGLPNFQLFGQPFQPSVAWRTVKLPNGRVAMAHQRALIAPVVIEEGGYTSGGCDNSIVHSSISEVDASASESSSRPAAAAIPFATLPVDLAVSDDGSTFALVAAGSSQVILTNQALLDSNAGFEGEGTCSDGQERVAVDGEPIAVAFAGSSVLVQTREPAAIQVLGGPKINLPGESRLDTGHEMFHRNPNGPMVCAGCHPEGMDDAHTWQFEPIGARRTQFVSGGILQTAPFHWDGDMSGIDAIMSEVFERRMGGMHQGPRRVRVFARWIDSLPAPPVSRPENEGAIERGKALFNDTTVACATCHAGEHLTNNKAADVGTGKAFQVPSLVRVSQRAPFMHDGCAVTLKDRFINPLCGGGDQHGRTSHLSDTQIDDLVTYLESL